MWRAKRGQKQGNFEGENKKKNDVNLRKNEESGTLAHPGLIMRLDTPLMYSIFCTHIYIFLDPSTFGLLDFNHPGGRYCLLLSTRFELFYCMTI